MRVCQPLPVALNCSSICASSRSVTCSFVPLPSGLPRPRLNWLNSASVSGKLSGSVSAAAVICASSSGVLSRIFLPDLVVRYIKFFLLVISLAQADHSAHVFTVNVHHAVEPFTNRTQCNHARFAIIAAGVLPYQCVIPFQLFSFGQ